MFHSDQFLDRPGDLWVCGYYKSGNTWVQEIIKLLFGFHPLTPVSQACVKAEWEFGLPLEVQPFNAIQEGTTSRVFSGFWPHRDHMARRPGCTGRIIYIIRNCADVAVSFFHHSRALQVYEFEDSWDTFFRYTRLKLVCFCQSLLMRSYDSGSSSRALWRWVLTGSMCTRGGGPEKTTQTCCSCATKI